MSEEELTQKAEDLYKKSEKLDCTRGFNNMGSCYDVGYGSIAPNAENSISMYVQAFERGYAGTADDLGVLYEEGGSLPMFKNCIDNEKVIEWYTKGYLCECPSATLHLAQWYDKGKPSGQDGKIIGQDREKELKLYQGSFKIFDRTHQFKDKCGESKEGLLKLCCVCILMEEPCSKIALGFLNDLKFITGKKKLKETRLSTKWMVCKELKREVFKNHRGVINGVFSPVAPRFSTERSPIPSKW